jgi:predicted nuclease of predicted toxin-antitoxin system
MRFLANENIPPSAIRRLREAWHDVLSARESMVGSADDVILRRAAADQRILLTFDKDVGELAFRFVLRHWPHTRYSADPLRPAAFAIRARPITDRTR